MKTGFLGILAVVVIGALILAVSALFTVRQTEQALVIRFGSPQMPIREAGLHFKAPFIDNVVYIEKRILDLDLPAQEVIASDQKRLVVDAFARYRVHDALLFYQTVGSVEGAANRLATFLNSSLRRVLGENTFQNVVRDARPQLMGQIRDQVNGEAQKLGLSVVDVKIRRADLPNENSQAIYDRMKTEREREAAEIRAQGGEAAQRIRSRADREVTVIIAEAHRDSEQKRGEGDAQRNAIYAEAYGRDPEFFAFYRSMQAYEQGLKGDNTRLVLSPDNSFFRFFNTPTGAEAAAPAGGQPGAGTAAPQ
ncbi:protein HflC [Agaricicola taiwanensis]|uniref:Protein HflC n=1 Tax=Agaricicola taiwanensis TaxID=591372 RepID=A0A8J2YHB7_9RHOB|nr:protease modulator HflC [Agaricicola taiwanensis]GGE42579.1 protein HflC [Agaricicola taiwanensis]